MSSDTEVTERSPLGGGDDGNQHLLPLYLLLYSPPPYVSQLKVFNDSYIIRASPYSWININCIVLTLLL